MSRRVEPSEQGQLQGALTALRGLTGLVGPVLFTGVFARAVEGSWGLSAGAPYALAAIVLGVALPIAVAATRAGGDRR
jgi:DHA1 family tetracycline resistance protein-like MFS transporter